MAVFDLNRLLVFIMIWFCFFVSIVAGDFIGWRFV